MTKLFVALCTMVTCSLLLGDETLPLASAESIAQPAVAENIIDSAGNQEANQLKVLRVIPNDEQHQLIQKVSNTIRLLVAERINSKLDLKITRRIMNKIGNIKYIVPDDVDYLTTKAAEIGTAVGLGQSVIGTAAGAANPAAGVATAVGFFVFQILKMGLDLGDAGGYGKIGTLENYIAINEKVVSKLKDTFIENEAKYPSEIGPLDKISNDDLNTKLEEQLNIMINPDNNERLFEPMWEMLLNRIKVGEMNDSDAINKSSMEMYLDLVDLKQVFRKFITIICIHQDGKIIDRGNTDLRCSYKDKSSCESSYSWPLKDGDLYAEFKSTRLNGTCIHAQYILKTICNENHLSYNTETGLCIVDEDYCKMKGADWGYNKRINENDCIITEGQEVAETIFGTTIVRGLKQLFDPKQYKTCNLDEFDDGYFCRLVKCTENEEENGGFCYPKCKEEFHPVGCCICSPNCPTNWTDDGVTCRKAGQCPPGKNHEGALCYDNCKESLKVPDRYVLRFVPRSTMTKVSFAFEVEAFTPKKVDRQINALVLME